MEREVYNIIDRETGEQEGSYERGNYTKYDFSSVDSARGSNCHGIYKNRVKYRIAKYKVTIELIDEDVDPPTEEEIEKHNKEAEFSESIKHLSFGEMLLRTLVRDNLDA